MQWRGRRQSENVEDRRGMPRAGGGMKLGGGIGMVLPRVEDFRGFLADAVDTQQAVLGRAEHRRGPAECLQQPPDADRADLWQHVERDECFKGSHHQ